MESERELVDRLGRAGLLYPRTTVEEAGHVGIPLSYALAFLESESSGQDEEGAPAFGLNVFDDEESSANPVRGGVVTRERYMDYLAHRRAGRGLRGVGPMQVRWWAAQEAADRMGGCWLPRYSMRIGLAHAKALIRRHGIEGAARYRGGEASDAYGREWSARASKWRSWLGQGPT